MCKFTYDLESFKMFKDFTYLRLHALVIDAIAYILISN